VTIYAHITDDVVDETGLPPETMFDDGRWWDLRPMTPEVLTPRGWFELVEVPRPPDTDTTTHDYSLTVVDGLPTQTWTPRPWTADETAARAEAAEHQATSDRVALIIDDLQAEKDRLQIIIDMTNADVNANPAGPIKDSARAGKRIADAAIDLAKFVRGD